MSSNILPKCPFLAIPAELRNRIYTLVFASFPEEVDLLAAIPAARDLVLTCKQIYNESAELYKAAFRSFWTDSTFIARVDYPSALSHLRSAISTFRDEDIAGMRYIHVHGHDAKWILDGDTWYTGTRRGGLHAWLVVPHEGHVPLELQRLKLCCRNCNILWVTSMSATEKEEASVKIGRGRALERRELDVMVAFEQKRAF